MLASLKKYKGIDQYFALAKKLEAHKDILFSCVLSCTDKEWLKYKENIQIPTNLTVFTQQKHTAPFYKQAHLVINLFPPDKWVETFGLTLLESPAFGIPVIAPNCGGPLEIVSYSIDGYLLDPYDLEKIALKIFYLKSNKHNWGNISQAAKIKSQKFSPSIFAEKINRLLN